MLERRRLCDVSPLIGLVYCPVLLVRFKSTVLFSLHLCPPKLGLFAVLRHVRGAGGAPVGQISHIGPEFRGAEAAVVGVQNTVPVGFCRLHAPVRRQIIDGIAQPLLRGPRRISLPEKFVQRLINFPGRPSLQVLVGKIQQAFFSACPPQDPLFPPPFHSSRRPV